MQETGNEVLFLGLIKHHTDKCANVVCPCKQNAKSTKNIFKDEDFLIKFMETNVNIIREKFEGNTEIGIVSLSFYVEVMKRFPKYFYEMHTYEKESLELHEKYSLLQI